jgi:hypothetical protein
MELSDLSALLAETFRRVGIPYLVTGSVGSTALPRLLEEGP